MPIRVIVTRDFDHLSEVAAAEVAAEIALRQVGGRQCVLGLATGASPTGMYRHLAKSMNNGGPDPRSVRTFNLDEYVGLPGRNAQERSLHPESYGYFMIQELFGLLNRKFANTRVPGGVLVEQEDLIQALAANPGDWEERGTDAGRAIAIRPDAQSEVLRGVRRDVLDAYEADIRAAGGIDLQVLGIGGKGHVAFHEAGIPFEGSRMLLVRLDDVTVRHAVADGHFPSERECPRYAVSMGAQLAFEARRVLVLASGPRKTGPVTRSLMDEPTAGLPISYGQIYAATGGDLLYLVDRVAGEGLLENRSRLEARGIRLEDRSTERARIAVRDIRFYRDASLGTLN
jgi:glucosamine-6-phosphate deaminase